MDIVIIADGIGLKCLGNYSVLNRINGQPAQVAVETDGSLPGKVRVVNDALYVM